MGKAEVVDKRDEVAEATMGRDDAQASYDAVVARQKALEASIAEALGIGDTMTAAAAMRQRHPLEMERLASRTALLQAGVRFAAAMCQDAANRRAEASKRATAKSEAVRALQEELNAINSEIQRADGEGFRWQIAHRDEERRLAQHLASVASL